MTNIEKELAKLHTKISVSLPVFVQHANSDVIDYTIGAYHHIFGSKIKHKELGRICDEQVVMFYVGNLPKKQDLRKLIQFHTSLADNEDLDFYMKHGYIGDDA